MTLFYSFIKFLDLKGKSIAPRGNGCVEISRWVVILLDADMRNCMPDEFLALSTPIAAGAHL